jgi:hypothetical protein
MTERVFLDSLAVDSVNLRKQNFTVIDGVEYPIGQPWRRAYVNSIRGRQEVQTEVVEPYKTAIFAVWGDAPTVEDTE